MSIAGIVTAGLALSLATGLDGPTGPTEPAGSAGSASSFAEGLAHLRPVGRGRSFGPGVCRGPIRIAFKPTRHGLGAEGYLVMALENSPFGVAVSARGVYRYRVSIEVTRLRRRPARRYVAWAATPDLGQVRRLGVVARNAPLSATLAWNQFLVFVTAEPESPDDSTGVGARWTGPILLTALSPSGYMHTMAGHGIFEAHTALC